MKVAAPIQNAIQGYNIIYKEKKRVMSTQTSLNHFFKRVDGIESSKEPEHVASTSCVMKLQLLLGLLLLMILQRYYLPLPLTPPVDSFLPVHSMPAPVCQLLYCTTVLFKVLYCMILNILFFMFFMYYLCEKYPWKKSYDTPRQQIKKQRHYFADKGPSSQS